MKYSNPIAAIVGRTEEQLGNNAQRHPHARQLLMRQRRLLNALQSLESVATNRPPSQTEEAHKVNVAKAAKRLDKVAIDEYNSIGTVISDARQAYENSANEKCGMVPSPLAPEVRQAFRAMSQRERFSAINQALKEQNGAVLFALKESPWEGLTGIPTDVVERNVDTLRQQVDPEGYADWQTFEDTQNASFAVLESITSACKQGFDPGEIARIEASEHQAQESQKSFEESLSA